MAGDLLRKISIPIQQTAQFKMNADKPAVPMPAANSSLSVTTSAPQLEYSAAVTLSPAATTPLGLTAQKAKGRLLRENIFQSAGSTIKGYGQCAKYLYKAAVNGEGTDYSVGKINDLTIRAGSLGIAGILAATKAFPFARGMEFVGLATWFGSMAIWPKVIGTPIKALYGVDINQKYEDSYGRRKNFYEDPQYLCWDLYRNIDKHGKYNPNAPEYEYLNKIGDKLGVPRDIEDRNTAIQDKMRQVATQGNALWMLTAGFMTPVLSSIVADSLQTPLSNGIQKMRVAKQEKKLDAFKTQLDGASKTAAPTVEKAFSAFGFKLDPEFEKSFGSVAKKEMSADEVGKLKEFLTRRYKGSEMLDAVLQEMDEKYIINDNIIPFDKECKMQESLVKASESAVEKLKNKILNERISPLQNTLSALSDVYAANTKAKVNDSTPIADILKGLNRVDKMKIGTNPIKQLSNFESMTVGEFKKAIRDRDYAKFGVGFVDKLKGLTREEIDECVKAGNYQHRSDGLKGFEMNRLIREMDCKYQWHLGEVLASEGLDTVTSDSYKNFASQFLHAEAQSHTKSLERGLLDVTRLKKLLSIIELNTHLESKIDDYAKVTIQDISESVTAGNWDKVPKKYLNAMGFSKSDIKIMSTTDPHNAAKTVKAKIFELIKSPEKYDKAVTEMSKYAGEAISKEEKALLNLIGTSDKPGVLQKLKNYMNSLISAEGFTDRIKNAYGKHNNAFAERFQVKVRNTINSFGRPIKALDALSRVDEFVTQQLGATQAEFEKRLENTAKLYMFQIYKDDFEGAKAQLRQYAIDALVENADINNWTTKFESAMPGNPRGIKHSAELLKEFNYFMYGEFSEKTAKNIPAELRRKFAAVSYESGFKFASIDNKLLRHVAYGNLDVSRSFFSRVFNKDLNTLKPAEKTQLLEQIGIIEEIIEGRRFNLDAKDITDLKNTVEGFKAVVANPSKPFDRGPAIEFLTNKLGKAYSSNDRITSQTGKDIVGFFTDAARNIRSRNKWTKLVWGLFAGTVGLSAVTIALMGKKNYFNKDVYAKKGQGGKNASVK